MMIVHKEMVAVDTTATSVRGVHEYLLQRMLTFPDIKCQYSQKTGMCSMMLVAFHLKGLCCAGLGLGATCNNFFQPTSPGNLMLKLGAHSDHAA
jgi:hypothetical protein